MKILYIVRGVPGSGKSTLGEKIADVKIEADDYFMHDGVYSFDKSKIQEAHQYARTRTEQAMIDTVESIAVCNTFTRKWEYEPYVNLAKKYDYKVIEIIVKSDFKNVHTVPEDTVRIMKSRFEY